MFTVICLLFTFVLALFDSDLQRWDNIISQYHFSRETERDYIYKKNQGNCFKAFPDDRRTRGMIIDEEEKKKGDLFFNLVVGR